MTSSLFCAHITAKHWERLCAKCKHSFKNQALLKKSVLDKWFDVSYFAKMFNKCFYVYIRIAVIGQIVQIVLYLGLKNVYANFGNPLFCDIVC